MKALEELTFAFDSPSLLKHQVRIAFTRTSLLNHFDLQTYPTQPPQLRLHQLLEMNVSTLLRSRLHAHPLCPRILQPEFALAWMLACSGCEEQHFLNACEATAANDALCSHHPSLLSLLIFSEILADHVALTPLRQPESPAFASLLPLDVPSLSDYREEFLQRWSHDCSALYANMTRMLDDKNTNIDDLNLLTRRWNASLQQLAAIFDPNRPSVLSRKYFNEQWHFSAYVMTACCIVSSLFPSQPHLLARRTATSNFIPVRGFAYHNCRTTLRRRGIIPNFARNFHKADPEERVELVQQLWQRVVLDNGCLFSAREVLFGFWNVGHESHLIACRLSLSAQQPLDDYFLIADPEISSYKLLSLDQFEALISQEDFQICFTDIPGIEKVVNAF